MSKFKNYFSIIIATTLLSTPMVTFAQESSEISMESSVTTLEDELTALQETLIEETPLTKEQIKALPTEFWNNLTATDGDDLKVLWEKIIEDFPELYIEEIKELRDKMKSEFLLTDQELDLFTDKALIWSEYQVKKANNDQEDLEKLAEEVRQYVLENATTLAEESLMDSTTETTLVSQDQEVATQEEISGESEVTEALISEDIASEEINEASANELTMNSAMRQAAPSEVTSETSSEETSSQEAMVDSTANQTMMRSNQVSSEPFDFAAIKKVMLEITPITEEEFNQISESQWQAIVDEVSAGGGDPSGTFNVAMKRYPSVFNTETEWLYNTLVSQEHFDNTLLREKVTPEELRWYDQFTLNSQFQTDFSALAAKITEKTGIIPGDVSKSRMQMMMEATPITVTQFNAITSAQWDQLEKDIMATGYGDIGTLYNWAVERYPSVFESEYQDLREILVEQYGVDGNVLDNAIYRPNVFWAAYMSHDKFGDVRFNLMIDELQKQANLFPGIVEETTVDNGKVIEHVKSVLIAKTPMTATQFSLLPAKDVLNIANAVDKEYVVIYNNFLDSYPDVFKAEIAMIRTELEKLGMNSQSLLKVSDQTLLWYEFEAFVANGNQANYKALADRLVKEGLASWNVQVTKTKSNLPNTGEAANKFVPFIGVGLIAVAAIVLLRKKNAKIDKH